jgi:hypothetical protein
MRPGLQLADWCRVFAAEGCSQLCSTFGDGVRLLADTTSALTDPEPVIAARAEIEAAEAITKPEMIATEAVFIIFIVAPTDPSCWGQINYMLTVMFLVARQKLQPAMRVKG